MPFLAQFCSAFAFGMAIIVLASAWAGAASAQFQGAAGNVRVNIEWNGDVDLDLYVTDPCGNVFGFGENTSATCEAFTGEWDHDDTGFGDRTDNPNAENIVWTDGAPVGRYSVHVNYFAGVDTTNYTIRIFYGNQTSTYSGSIGPEHQAAGRRHIADFDADASVNLSTITISPDAPSIGEGGTAGFTLTATPPPANPLAVSVTVGETGQFAASGQTGSKTVTIGTSGTGTLSVRTEDDTADEPDGEITATVDEGSDYTVSSSGNSVSITVRDNDENESPMFGDGVEIADQSYVQNRAIDPLTLPAASGDDPITYELSPDPPDGLTFDPTTRELSGTPTATSPAGTYTYMATDADGESASLSFTITVEAAEPPGRFTYRLCARDHQDPDGDRVNIRVNGQPVFSNLELKTSEACKDITLERNPSRNTISVQALNVGNPPQNNSNTAELLIRNATSRAELRSERWGLGAGEEQGWAVYAISENEVDLRPIAANQAQKNAIQGTVAGVAAATVSNVTSNIGARFSAPSAPTGGVSVSVAGSPLSFGQARSKHGEPVFPAHRVGAAGEDRWQWRHRTMSADDLLRSSSFAVSLGAAEGTESVSPGLGSRVTIWGRGDLQFFESGGGSKSGYDGDLVAGYLGADLAMEGGWLAGIAVSRIASEADYTLGAAASGGGTLEAELTNVHPYIRAVLGERSEAWAILGFGTGEVTDSVQDGPESKSDLSMRMLSAGLRHLLESDMGIDLAVLGDGSFATVETEDGVQSVDGISADVWRARLGVEASRTTVSESGSSVTSFLEVAARTDGGDGAEGVGLELSPGLSFSDPDNGFAFEARGRALALHSADNHREYGASLTASLAPGAGGRGLSMALTPSWGTPDDTLDGSDRSLFLGDAGDRRSDDTLSLNARLAYGFGAGKGLLSPFAELSIHDDEQHRIRVGSRYSVGPSLDLELSGDRSDRTSGSAAHSVQVSGRIRF